MKGSNFWEKAEKPIVASAPMAGVTDAAFRRVMAKYSKYGGSDDPSRDTTSFGALDVIFTEFVSADGLFLAGKEELADSLSYTEEERPVVAQFFSPDPDRMKRSAAFAKELGFDGIDLNMGCPDRAVCKQGAGAEVIKTPELAQKIIKAAKEGASDMPVSVKTRAGYFSDSELNDWITAVLETEPAALTLHARTKKDMYKVPARWDLVKQTVELRDKIKVKTSVLGNGDISSMEDLYEKVSHSQADGAMVGRALFGNPWFFDERKISSGVSVAERLRVLVEHCKLFEDLFADRKSFALMKKHYKAYVSGWDGAKELRIKLMTAKSASEVERLVDNYLSEVNIGQQGPF